MAGEVGGKPLQAPESRTPEIMTSKYHDFQHGHFEGSGSGLQWGISDFRRPAPVVRILLIVNAAVFLLQLIFRRFLGIDLVPIFGLSAQAAIGRFWIWQFVTSMFLHSPQGIFHILFNMLMLWVFGRDVEARLGSRRFLLLYFGSGLVASLCFTIVGILGLQFAPMVGASGAVMGVMVAFAMIYPEALLLAFLMIPIRAKHLVLFLIAIDLLYFVFMTGDSNIAHSAHLGGALFGFLFIRYESRVEQYVRGLEIREKKKAIEEERRVRQRVDHLLDKISKDGIHTLSGKERKFLRDASKKFK